MTRHMIIDITRDLKFFFAEYFTMSNKARAMKLLDKKGQEIRKTDLAQIMFFTGASIVPFCVYCMLFGIPAASGVDDYDEI